MPNEFPPRVATITVMVGLPAAGKTTVARRIEAERGAIRLTPDEWMIPLFNDSDAGGKRDVLEGRFIWLALAAARSGVDVICDFGVWSRDERSALRALAEEVGAECELIYLAVDPVEQLARIDRRRVDHARPTFDIGEDDLRRYAEMFEEPDSAELEATTIPAPPPGWSSWRDWATERWPTYTD